MHKYISLFFSVTFLLLACEGNKDGPAIMDQGRMVTFLTELHIADGSLYNITQSPDSMYKYGTARYLHLFKRLNVDSAEFRRSFKYYSARPIELQAIYDKVMANLKQKTDSLNNSEAQKIKKNGLPAK